MFSMAFSMRLESPQRAAEILEEVRGLISEAHPYSPKKLIVDAHYAVSLARTGRAESALEVIDGFRDRWFEVLDSGSVQSSGMLEIVAETYERAGRSLEAVRHLTESIRTRREFLTRELSFMSEGERLEMGSRYRGKLDDWVSKTLGQSEVDRETIYREVVLWKGLVSRGLLKDRWWLRGELDEESRNAAARLKELASALPEDLFRFRQDEGRSLGGRLADLQVEYKTLERELFSTASRGTGAGESQEAAGIVTLPLPDEAVLDFFVYRDADEEKRRVIAFVLREDGIAVCELGDEEPIRRAIDFYSDAVEQRNQLAVGLVGWEVYERVWKPLEPHVEGAKRLLISPDGVLWRLPFAAIPTGEDEYLVESCEITYTGFAPWALRGDGGGSVDGGLLCVGGVAFAEKLRSPSGQEREMEPLVETLSEVKTIERVFRGKHPSASVRTLTGSEGTEPAIEEHAKGARYVHIASHALVQTGEGERWMKKVVAEVEAESGDEGPAVSRELLREWIARAATGIVVACGEDDGILTSEELSWFDLDSTELVTLAACRSGEGLARIGEGIEGLRRAAQMAGARNVLTSIWPVEDLEGRELMEAFYDALWNQGLEIPAALHQAQRKALEATRKARGWGDPRAWGGLVLDGQWKRD